MDMREIALNCIDEYLYVLDFEKPQKWSSKSDIAHYSQSKWTCEEIAKLIKSNPDVPISVLLENFIKKTDDYACRIRGYSYPFTVAHDVSENLLDDICRQYRKEKKYEKAKCI